jgi:hypothetical protein
MVTKKVLKMGDSMNFKSLFFAALIAGTFDCMQVNASSFKGIVRKSTIVSSLIAPALNQKNEKKLGQDHATLPLCHARVQGVDMPALLKKQDLTLEIYDALAGYHLGERARVMQGATLLKDVNPKLYALFCEVKKDLGIEEEVLVYADFTFAAPASYIRPIPCVMINEEKTYCAPSLMVVNPKDKHFNKYGTARATFRHELEHLLQHTIEGYAQYDYHTSLCENAAEAAAAGYLSCYKCLESSMELHSTVQTLFLDGVKLWLLQNKIGNEPFGDVGRMASLLSNLTVRVRRRCLQGYFAHADWKLYADADREQNLLCQFHTANPDKTLFEDADYLKV